MSQTIGTQIRPNKMSGLIWVQTLCKIYAAFIYFYMGLRREKPCLQGFANNTGADQPAHPRSLISAFVIHFVESIICKLAPGEISIFWLVPVAKETGLKLTLSETLKTGFVTMRPIYCMCQVERLWLPRLKLRVRVQKNNFLISKPKHKLWVFLNQNICCGYSKESYQ